MIGASLFYGDAIITPAISVLSSIEGLNIVTPAFEPIILGITLAIIVGLFAVQSAGTEKVARFFGRSRWCGSWPSGCRALPISLVNPAVLWSVNPLHAIHFLGSHGTIGLVTLGAVFLAVTGAEALYADLGHFGKRPIRMAWLWLLVLPTLVLNYLGQGATLLLKPDILENPFFLTLPDWALVPMVITCSAGNHHSEPGCHHGGLFADATGRAAWIAAPHGGAIHIGQGSRADLPAASELAAAESA